MTTEIAILNVNGVALATDSAGTTQDGSTTKIFDSVNKLFTLSLNAPVGIMIYGNMSLLGMPWEVLIKQYRNNRQDPVFNSLEEYAEDFIHYLEQHPLDIFSPQDQDEFLAEKIYRSFQKIQEKSFQTYKQRLHSEQRQRPNISEIFDAELQKQLESLRNHSFLDPFSENSMATYKESIKPFVENLFSDHTPYHFLFLDKQKHFDSVLECCVLLFLKDLFSPESSTGVVFAGYGTQEIFPSLISYTVEGFFDKKLRKKVLDKQSITTSDTVAIIPFAQTDTIESFVYGTDLFYIDSLLTFIKKTFSALPDIYIQQNAFKGTKISSREKYKKTLQEICNKSFEVSQGEVRNIIQRNMHKVNAAVRFLPKDKLAELAESLVHITCIKRKMSFVNETVGGAIDVAVISKGDGFVWVKRKHYFSSELNPHFFRSYYMKGISDLLKTPLPEENVHHA